MRIKIYDAWSTPSAKFAAECAAEYAQKQERGKVTYAGGAIFGSWVVHITRSGALIVRPWLPRKGL